MRVISAAEVQGALDTTGLIHRLREAFRRGDSAPPRQLYELTKSGPSPDQSLSLTPAWDGRFIGVKTETVTPDNPDHGLPAVISTYLLMNGHTGSPEAMIDGPTLTLRRTAATSALASSYLSRSDCERLLMVGTGALAPHLIEAHAKVRPIVNVLIWGRDPRKAKRLAKAMDRRNFRVDSTEDLEGAVRGAHVISTATSSDQALIKGEWLPEGAHLDLTGAVTPQMCEADPECFSKARVFVDTRPGTLAEAGDLLQAIKAGALNEEDIAADLYELSRGEKAGRRFYDQITLFKSVGAALEDLAAAALVVERI